jgi:hypothetical protein
MRHDLHLVLGLGLALSLSATACGSDGGGGNDDGGDDGAPMPDGGFVDPPPPARGFQVISPDVTIMPGQEITYCYYFRTPNTEELAIKKWSSAMTPGSHHMILYTTQTERMPAGTVSSGGCSSFGVNNVPSWTYSAQTPTQELALPADDGAGKPLGQRIAAGTPAYLEMHYLNGSDSPLKAHVTLNAEAHEAGAVFTQTAPYVTYNTQISVGPGATNVVETQTCNVPANVKFWTMSTHAHKQAVKTAVKDGTAVAFSSTDWEHPGSATWLATPFFTFASSKLTYECTYNNIGDNKMDTVVSGPSAEKNEMCMAVGYYFPANKSLFCLNSFGPF